MSTVNNNTFDCPDCKWNKRDGDYSLCTNEGDALDCPRFRAICDPAVVKAYEEEKRENAESSSDNKE